MCRSCKCAGFFLPVILLAERRTIYVGFFLACQENFPVFVQLSSTQSGALNIQVPCVSGIELPTGVLQDDLFPIVILWSAWLARISLMASSGVLESICNRFWSVSSKGRIWLVGSCRLACCPQRTYVGWQVWGQGVWLLL